MNKVRITAIRQTVYSDLMDKYENPIEHTCDVREGQQWISEKGECPVGMCPSAWSVPFCLVIHAGVCRVFGQR